MGSFTILSPGGDEREAQLFADAEFERLASELDDEPPAPPAQSKVYTAYLFPFGGPGYTAGHDNDPARIHFPYADGQALAATMRREVERLFTTGGAERVKHLEHGIFLPSRLRQLSGGGPPALRHYPNVVPFSSLEEDRAACETVLAAWRTANADVLAQAKAAVPEVQKLAQDTALQHLYDARTQILSEATNYLAGESPESLLRPDLPEGLVDLRAGPKLAGLIDAWRDLQACRDAVERAGNPAAVNEAAAYLALRLSLAVMDFPVLHRMWSRHHAGLGAIPPSVQVLQLPGGPPILSPGSTDGFIAVTAFRAALVSTLRTAWAANAEFTRDVRNHPAHVWRYAPLIGRTLDAMFVPDPSIVYRAAQDRLEDEEGTTWVGVLSMANAALALGAHAVAAAPPVGLVLAIAGAVLSVMDVTLDYLKRREQEAAHQAVLDPRLSVASEPGYLGLLVGAAFAVLDIKGVRDAVIAARAVGAGRQAAGLVDMVTP